MNTTIIINMMKTIITMKNKVVIYKINPMNMKMIIIVRITKAMKMKHVEKDILKFITTINNIKNLFSKINILKIYS